MSGPGAGSNEDETGIRIPPPVVFLAAILLAVLVGWAAPLRLGLPPAIRWPLAVAMMVPVVAILPSILAAFRRAGSAYDVRKVPHGLVTDGAFRFSRNPGYVLFALFFAGIAIALDNGWGLIFVAASVVFVHFQVVLKEEAVLEKRFGGDYLAYKRRVRRWL